ncbi:tetratricopeptide repeat protein [Streptomyces sp. NBC_01356]|uniref:tetratricopeptide repeat protein n=1 Tax=Streptomyces sp. NBC_01356 TaxID=2903836 RepID=UPI002E36CEBB|nr:tetratricopeptide repeat protein [Streptomyces sp. NBC_01356]
MVRARPSMRELITGRTRRGFVGRGAERAAFRENLELPPEDERHRFLFHVHGNAGVGKSFLVRELEQLARERGALTAYVDESVGSLPEAMTVIAEHFARQGHRFKALERLLATHRERRHEAAAVVDADPDDGEPSVASMTAARAGLVGLGLVPGVGAFAGALDPAQLAQGTDRLRAGLSARFRTQEDVQLVLSPERVLTPVFLKGLDEAAAQVPWLVLVFDTYEWTGPFLDGWLHDVMTTDRYGGALPANLVVVTAGQHPLAPARWGGLADFVTEVPLGPFTEAEVRGLLADKGVMAEPVVEEVLRLTGGLPVLVSTLAEQRPADPDDIGDPSATAVERFLKWEQDPVRKAVALACALPRRLDMDVFRAAVDCPDEEADTLFGWLHGLPFVDERGDRLLYHDLVREPMLRLQRRRSPRKWAERHEILAGAIGRWREEVGADLLPYGDWEHEPWRELRLEEMYHLLCSRPLAALPGVLRDLIGVCGTDQVVGRRWARMLQEAGEAAGASDLKDWGHRLGEALADDEAGTTRAMDLLLAHPGLTRSDRALAHTLRGIELRDAGEHRQALSECDRAIELDPDLDMAHHNRGLALRSLGDIPAALAAFDCAERLTPHTGWVIAARGNTYRLAGRYEEAVADFDRAVTLDPTNSSALATRGVCRHALGRHDEALADFDSALRVNEDYIWALVRRARLHGDREEWDKAFADLDRAARLSAGSAWVASERGNAYRLASRFEEAVTELGRALSLIPDYASALASRGASLHELGRNEEALADLDRTVELAPDYSWALVVRAQVKGQLGDQAGMFEDLLRAREADPEGDWIHLELGHEYRAAGRYEEAIAVFHRLLEGNPEHHQGLAGLGATHHRLKAYEEALRYVNRALAVRPDYEWAYVLRARVCLATGRSEQALADLDRCVGLESEADWARGTAIGLLVLCGRWDEASARLADADRAATPDDLDELRVEMHRHTRQWEQARRIAERLREAEPLAGTFQLAVTVGRSEGPRAAEPLWWELARLVHEDDELGALERAQARCSIGCALANWADADQGLDEILALAPGWDDLANLAAILTDLLHSAGADRSRLAPRLAAVAAARDAIQARYAE